MLDPDDFAISDERPDPPPSDLVDKDIWSGVTHLPDHVSIRTSDHHGSLLKMLYECWGDWIEAVGNPDLPDAMFNFMLDAADDLSAATFLAVHGYYAQAFGLLRGVLELSAIGCVVQLTDDSTAAGRGFGYVCDRLLTQPKAVPLQEHVTAKLGFGMFEPSNSKVSSLGGWCRRLYRTLSKFAHAAPGHASGDIWKSNGPIYKPDAFERFVEVTAEVLVTCLAIFGPVEA